MKLKNWFIGGANINAIPPNVGLALLRIFTGLSLALAHGINKLPPSDGFIETVGKLGFVMPDLFAWLSGCAEFFGGLLLVIGFLTRPAALFITINLSVAAFLRHAADPFSSKERALLYLAIAILLLISGSGKYGIDSLFRKHPRTFTR